MKQKQKMGLIGLVVLVGFIGLIGFILRGNSQKTLTPEQAAIITAQKEAETGIDSSPTATRYIHPRIGFSFDKPEGYTVGAFNDGPDAETLVVQKIVDSNADTKVDLTQKGFQIYFYPVNSAVELTPQFIQSELPETRVQNAVKIDLDGASGIMFESNNDSFGGSSYEIWFYMDGYVYQVSSYATFINELQGIIGTWKF